MSRPSSARGTRSYAVSTAPSVSPEPLSHDSRKHVVVQPPRETDAVDRVSSEPVGAFEKEAASLRLRKNTDVFDLDLVKRRDSRPKASVYLMEKKGRDRVWKASMNVLVFPVHLAWWRRRVPTSRPYLYRLSFLYILQSVCVVRECIRKPTETPVEFVELMIPFLLLVVMAGLMGQASASSIAPIAKPVATPPVSDIGQAPPAAAPLPSPAQSEMSAREQKKRELKRRISKNAVNVIDTVNNDSTTEIFTNDEMDGTGTGSSDSDSSDTSSDSSTEEGNMKHRRPHVAVRRSSLLGAPTSPQPLGLPPASTLTTQENITARTSVLAHNSVPRPSKSPGLPPRPPINGQHHPSSPNNLTSNQRGRKSRIFFPRMGRHHTEPISTSSRDLNIENVEEEGDSDTEEEEHEVVNGLENEAKLNGANTESERGLHRNRLFSQSMDDVLDAVKSVHWSVHGPEKVFLTPHQIRAEVERKVFEVRMSESYRHLALAGALVVSLVPVGYRLWLFGSGLYCRFVSLRLVSDLLTAPPVCETCLLQPSLPEEVSVLVATVLGTSFLDIVAVVVSAVSNFTLSYILLGHVAGAVETFKRRHLYAKYFGKLTSSRKARRAGLPYFHLHKVDHIKVWLSLRSRRNDLDREFIGPYRASDTLAHFLFMVAIFLVGVVAFRSLQNVSGTNQPNKAGGALLSSMGDWILVAWAVILGIFVQRIMDLASKTHERFQNTSVLLTEELNIHMRLLRKPGKKDELNACNQMLKVAAALIKELEGGKSKKSQGGALVLDPWLYSIVRVVLLSALGALSSDLFGFRVRLWKI